MKTYPNRVRYLALAFAFVMLLAVTACSANQPESQAPASGSETAPSSISTAPPEPVSSSEAPTPASSAAPEAPVIVETEIPLDNAQLYKAAVVDAMTIETDEIFPLVEITPDSELCSWNDAGQVLMLTHHSYPDSYIAGEEYTLSYGEVWTFTDKEIIAWYKENKDAVTDWPLRFKQLIGLPEGREYTHFSAMWCNTGDVTRPGYEWELADTTGAAAFDDEPSEEYKAWFDSNIIWSYFDSAYPWTRLGYTYDWAADSDEYGLSEFIVAKDAVTTVEFTMTTDEFVAWLDSK